MKYILILFCIIILLLLCLKIFGVTNNYIEYIDNDTDDDFNLFI